MCFSRWRKRMLKHSTNLLSVKKTNVNLGAPEMFPILSWFCHAFRLLNQLFCCSNSLFEVSVCWLMKTRITVLVARWWLNPTFVEIIVLLKSTKIGLLFFFELLTIAIQLLVVFWWGPQNFTVGQASHRKPTSRLDDQICDTRGTSAHGCPEDQKSPGEICVCGAYVQDVRVVYMYARVCVCVVCNVM